MSKAISYDFLLIGAGLFNAVIASEATKEGKKCLVVEKRKHIGGNLYCRSVEGINIHEYGPHIFHTDNPTVWNYVSDLTEFNHFVNSPLARYKNKLYNLPFKMNTFYDPNSNRIQNTKGGKTSHFVKPGKNSDGTVYYEHYSYITINNASDTLKTGNFYDMMCVLLHEEDHYTNYNPYTYDKDASEFYAFGTTIYNEYFEYASKEFRESIISQYERYKTEFFNSYGSSYDDSYTNSYDNSYYYP